MAKSFFLRFNEFAVCLVTQHDMSWNPTSIKENVSLLAGGIVSFICQIGKSIKKFFIQSKVQNCSGTN